MPARVLRPSTLRPELVGSNQTKTNNIPCNFLPRGFRVTGGGGIYQTQYLRYLTLEDGTDNTRVSGRLLPPHYARERKKITSLTSLKPPPFCWLLLFTFSLLPSYPIFPSDCSVFSLPPLLYSALLRLDPRPSLRACSVPDQQCWFPPGFSNQPTTLPLPRPLRHLGARTVAPTPSQCLPLPICAEAALRTFIRYV